jgi:hypothetical protein
MTRRLPVSPSPGPLEEYAASFDDLFRTRAQREGFRRYLEGLLLPAERNKTLTALANTEPVAGAQRREAQSLQWVPIRVWVGCQQRQRAPAAALVRRALERSEREGRTGN